MKVIKMDKRSIESLFRALICGLLLFFAIYGKIELDKSAPIDSFKNFLVVSFSVFWIFLFFYLLILFTVSIFKKLKSIKQSGLRFGLWIFLFFTLLGLLLGALFCLFMSSFDATVYAIGLMIFGLFIGLVLGLVYEF